MSMNKCDINGREHPDAPIEYESHCGLLRTLLVQAKTDIYIDVQSNDRACNRCIPCVSV